MNTFNTFECGILTASSSGEFPCQIHRKIPLEEGEQCSSCDANERAEEINEEVGDGQETPKPKKLKAWPTLPKRNS